MLWSKMTPEMVKGADAKTNSIKLAKEILGDRDWQVGVTKVFIKVCTKIFLHITVGNHSMVVHRMLMISI